jgi:NADH:ubiquinone oxidoreductase subunit F (NADH-binding)
LSETLLQTSICGLGQVALGPMNSVLERFPQDVPAGKETP